MTPNNLTPPVLVRPNVNGLQVLWLQESGIDRLWGKPLQPVMPNIPSQKVQGGVVTLPSDAPQQAEPQRQAASQSPIRRFVRQSIAPEIKEEEVSPPVVIRAEIAHLDWGALRENVANCTRCNLAEQRKQAVFGEGAQPADWLFVEESPGEQDDWHGQPFMGKAGTLFDNMLKALGLQRETVFTTPLVKCRAVANIAPSKEEVASCQGFLQEQIERVQPKCIVVFGRAANTLLGTNEPTEALRGKPCSIKAKNGQAIPVVVTYHPNHLMVMQSDKAKVWQDLQRALQVVKS